MTTLRVACDAKLEDLDLDLDTKSDYFKEGQIKLLLSESSEINISDFIYTINRFDIQNDLHKVYLFQKFLENPQSLKMTSGNLIEMIDEMKIKDEKNKTNIIVEYLKSPKSSTTTIDDVIEMINKAGIKEELAKATIIYAFLNFTVSSEEINPKDVAKMVKEVGLETNTDLAIQIFDIKFSEPKENYIKNFINFAKELHQNQEPQFDCVKQFIIQKATTIDDVIEMIKQVGVGEDFAKASIIYDFLKLTESSEEINPKDVAKMVKEVGLQTNTDLAIQIFDIKFSEPKENYIENLVNFAKELNQEELVQCFTKLSEEINLKDAAGILIGAGLETNADLAIQIFDIKFSEPKENYIENLIKFAKELHQNELPQFDFVKQFIIEKATNIDNVIEMIKQAKIEDENKKTNIIVEYFESPKSSTTTIDDVIKMITQAGIEDDFAKAGIINAFLSPRKSSEEINPKDVAKMVKEVGLENNVNLAIGIFDIKFSEPKENYIENFINFAKELNQEELVQCFTKLSEDITPQNVAKMVKRAGLENNPNLAIGIFDINFPEPEENYIENLIKFTKELYQNELMQFDFVQEFIIPNKINPNNVKDLKPFIEGLQDNDSFLDIIKNLYNERLLQDEKDTLSLVKNRSKKQYAFLTEVVGDKVLNDCITEDGIELLKATFGDDLKVGDQPITVSDLISYFDIRDEISSLSTILKPEFKQQLRDNFVPSAEILLYKPEELEKLNSLMSEEGTIFDVKSYFVENAKLCDYLKEKVGPIDAIESGKTYEINFGNFQTPQEKQTELNTLFNELLQSNDLNKEDVAKFFSELFQCVLPEGQDKKNELAVFFKNNKKELAHCFCNENLPKENFTSLLTTLQDGCFANIGTQFTSMLYGVMIKEEDDKVLYGVMSSKIISSIGNNQDINHGQDVGNDGKPLDSEIIKAYLLSPMALIEKLSKEEMLTSAKTWEIIKKNLGDNHEIIYRLTEKYTEIKESNIEEFKIEDFNKKAKEIASYLIIKNVVGEEKMTDLESKNPQLQKLGDLIYGRVPEPSPSSISVDLSGPGHER